MNANLNVKTEDETTASDNNGVLLQIDSNDSITIEKKLRVEDFRLLRERFNRETVDDTDITTKTDDKKSGSLNKEEFIESFESILDLIQYKNQLEKLFDKLNSKETGLINWNDFCTYMLQFYQEEDYANTLRISPFNNEPKIRHVPHNKQELTAKILHLDNPVRFINISKEGYLGLWTPYLNLERIYTVIDELDDGTNGTAGVMGQNRRRAGTWITDAIYMPDVHKLVLTSTSRDLRFFTITSETFLEDFVLFGIKNVPTCLEYYPSQPGGNSESSLIFGDDCGYIHILYFKNPINSLFDPVKRKTDTTKYDKLSANPTQRIFWDELKEHEKFVKYHSMGAIHREYVRKILYLPHNNSIIASSGDNRNSLIITNINKLKKPYIFRLYKGCECFDYSKELNLLITGGADYLARIWNPYVTQKNVAILEGHHAAVIDIKINERLAQCYTFSYDAMVKAWDLKEFFCLQTISVRFPSTLGGKKPSFGLFPMDLYLNKSTNTTETTLPGGLVLACNDYLCLMKLGQDLSRDGSLTETHVASVSCAVYNPKLKQLITCADNSSIGAWDIESGRKAYFILDAHDGEEITCIAMDRSYRKIATGARNGVIKLWNSANGQNLLVLPSVQDAEITGIIFFDKGIITVGWSRKIVKYPDIISELVVPKADLTWRGSQIHRDDILCLDHLLPVSNIMCTASYDGEINVWSIDTEKLIMCLRKGSATELRRSPSNYRRSSSRRSIANGPVPIDKLLFLRSRAKENMKFGVLISSEGGNLNWWSLYGERRHMGVFDGSSKSGESILAMCTDASNRYLICGDTHGEIRVWNIENYCCSTASPVLFDSTTPPLVHFWQAHLSPIIFCEWTDYKGQGDFILTGSTDHTARLWTISGEEIGIFGQRQLWDIELIIPSRVTIDDEQIREKSANNNGRDPYAEIKLTTVDKINNLPVPEIAINIEDDDKRPVSSISQHSEITNLSKVAGSILHRTTLSPPVSGLGLLIERGLNQQKLKRQERRHRFSEIDGRHLAKGGGCYAPFALLSTQDIDDGISNLSHHHLHPKSMVIEELYMGSKNDFTSTTSETSKSRLALPPIIQRQQTSSSFESNGTSTTSTTFDVETNNRFPLASRHNTFMKSISEIS
ncbi:unnamed protein product [Rotaria magnacalcarata]|uniref:EF-hand domain-containing protein n=1 Tax=Rotaria magnacalcarata TaxID=392030 RepID=A0A814DQ90_9BILA|nr:unnamed protein product [Rotaria magnacalcarata]CAF1671330.1 unnamed protein product [Rotaria magnacalcarata]CAF2116254.1 unnamed protein product [Rotaria magnacalcarata]